MIKVLFTKTKSNYHKAGGFDCYDIKRGALSSGVSEPAIYHPPCRLFSRLRSFSNAGKCEKFLAYWAIMSCRQFGGVVEHPLASTLFKEMGCRLDGSMDEWGGFLIRVNLSDFGFQARKPTLLYIVGCGKGEVPPVPIRFDLITRSVSSSKRKGGGLRPIKDSERSDTPFEMITWLRELICVITRSKAEKIKALSTGAVL